jgi:hypothetical protein
VLDYENLTVAVYLLVLRSCLNSIAQFHIFCPEDQGKIKALKYHFPDEVSAASHLDNTGSGDQVLLLLQLPLRLRFLMLRPPVTTGDSAQSLAIIAILYSIALGSGERIQRQQTMLHTVHGNAKNIARCRKGPPTMNLRITFKTKNIVLASGKPLTPHESFLNGHVLRVPHCNQAEMTAAHSAFLPSHDPIKHEELLRR